MEIIESISKQGYITYDDSRFKGLERFKAREVIAKYLEDNGFLVKKEEVISNVSISDRSKTPVEILVLPQWFVKMEKFKDLILNNLKSKDSITFYPKRLKTTMKQWMEKVRDWNISRQLWWGHRIPSDIKMIKLKFKF
ncbi:class I tRNA ligase family protein [Mycoplasmopsis cynos]|nr:class I tRNA ligase family protein [Mycoplasmopsis cynos]WAM09986.1 class I tRNA ligase family protein [Mycoplasmopsis cynos]